MRAQVRVVCSSNGVFLRQPSGSLEYEGGEIRLVNVSSASTLDSLKEALDRVVSRNSQSKSMSGAPKARTTLSSALPVLLFLPAGWQPGPGWLSRCACPLRAFCQLLHASRPRGLRGRSRRMDT